MARETRGSTARDAVISPGQSDAKRKRRSSPDAARGHDSDGVNETPESKRQRRANGTDANDEESEADTPRRPGRLLSREVRDAVKIVLAQMAKGLPPPINNVLTLWLPPDFVKTEENTLGYVLQQDTLTWEQLHSTLHLFAENLLLPCAYPNPVPSLTRIHLPVPPLPSQFAPMAIYLFCAALRELLLQVEPLSDGVSRIETTQPLERWALMQKTPGNGLGTAGGEWFTSAVDLRELEAARKSAKIKNGQTLLSSLAQGSKFGHAQPVIVQATGVLGTGEGGVPTLSESVLRRASLKAQRWKENRALRRATQFGNVLRPIKAVTSASVPFTPSFAPTYNSQGACGLGYYSTLDIMHENARHKEWLKRSTTIVDATEGWKGSESEAKSDEKSDSVDDILDNNAELINELQIWQELRVRKGDSQWVSEREGAVADTLFASLASLVETTDTPPSALLPETKSTGLAHTLARRLLSNDAPAIRGTLDKRRPQALHDNVTIRLRAQAAAAVQQPTPQPQQPAVNGVPQSPRAQPPKTPGTPGSFLPSPQMREAHIAQPHRQPQPHYYTPPANRGYPNVSMQQTPQSAPMPMRMPQGYPQQQAAGMGTSPTGTPQSYARPGSSGAVYTNQGYVQANYQRQPLTAAAAAMNVGQMSPQMVPMGNAMGSPMGNVQMGQGSPMGNQMGNQIGNQMGQGSPYPPRMVQGPGPSNLRQSYGPIPTGLPPGVPTMPVMYGSPMQQMRMQGVAGMPVQMPGQIPQQMQAQMQGQMQVQGQMPGQMVQMPGQMPMHHR